MAQPEPGDRGDEDKKSDEEQSTPSQASSSLTDEELEQMMEESTQRAAEDAVKSAEDDAGEAAEDKRAQEEDEDRGRAEEDKDKDPASRLPPFLSALLTKEALLIGIPSLILIGAIGGYALHEPAERPRVRRAVKESPADILKPKTEELAAKARKAKVVQIDTPKVEAPKAEVAEIDSAEIRVQQTCESILGIAPHIYYNIKLELIDKTALDKAEIFVKGGPWKGLSAPERVDLLNQTSAILREQYPSSKCLMRFIFDDGRKSLDFRAAD